MQHRSLYIPIAVAVLVLIGAVFFALSRTTTSSAVAEFGGVSLLLEYAITDTERERGLGGRESIPNNYGMLFVFEREDAYGFWMKNMKVPLDIFWLDSQGHVVSIARNVATSTYPTVLYPEKAARYVLETRAGFADAYFIATGTPLRLKNLKRISE